MSGIPYIIQQKRLNNCTMPKQSSSKLRNRRTERKTRPYRQRKSNVRSGGPSRKRATKRTPKLSAAAALLLDPCGGPLTPGFHSTSQGILSRFKTQKSVGSLSSGYIIWSPHYADGTTSRHNCFEWNHADSAIDPSNSIANPYGNGGSSAQSLNVGANTFVSGQSCADFRLMTACMKLTYTGSISDCQGMVCRISNIPADTILHGNSANDPISVNDLFTMSSDVQRLSLDTMEQRFRPDLSIADQFKGSHDSVIYVPGGTPSTLTAEAKRFDPTFFGFAWKGIAPDSLNVSFTQNIEWRPDGASGIVAIPAKQVHDAGYLADNIFFLDRYMPGWEWAAKAAWKHRSGIYRTVQKAWAPGNMLEL